MRPSGLRLVAVTLSSPIRRRWRFAALYFSEGAPIGFIWWALPTRLAAEGVSIGQITALTSLLVLPWTLKFLWAPLVDACQTPRWTLRHWIVAAQFVMAAALAPLFWLHPAQHFEWLRLTLLIHCIAAATQDIAIDAWCVELTREEERGRMNGWMQTGMLLGRSLLGGGALVISDWGGPKLVYALLLLAILPTSLLVIFSSDRVIPRLRESWSMHYVRLTAALRHLVRRRVAWLGLGFALIAGAAFEALGAVQGPLLLSHGWSEAEVGSLTAGPMVLLMVLGALLGGRMADRWGHVRVSLVALLWIALQVTSVGLLLLWSGQREVHRLLPLFLCGEALGIGLLTAASYALFMDLTDPQLAATQFTTYMAATNACEAWAGLLVGQLIGRWNYGPALLMMAGLSLVGLAFLLQIPTALQADRGLARPASVPPCDRE
ncbi:MAG: MFS transporter [Planctomycetaceae bacterium]|nr:MFS transporter [Planctomycetaceae bacterium]